MRIVPAFYPRSARWYAAGPRGLHIKAAGRWATLKAKLPADAVIEGYYPGGYASVEARNVMRRGEARVVADAAERETDCKAQAYCDQMMIALRAAGKIL